MDNTYTIQGHYAKLFKIDTVENAKFVLREIFTIALVFPEDVS